MSRLKLKELRDLTTLVLHPADQDGALVLDQLNRIGCRTEAVWPPPKSLPASVDVVFAGISHDTHPSLMRMMRRSEPERPPVIAIVDYENPAMLQLVIEIDALAVISKPVRPFGILTNLAVARNAWLTIGDQTQRIRRLEDRLAAQKNIAKATAILMEAQGVSERTAYRTIRSQAMTKRVSIDEMAVAIINANDLLSSRIDDA